MYFLTLKMISVATLSCFLFSLLPNCTLSPGIAVLMIFDRVLPVLPAALTRAQAEAARTTITASAAASTAGIVVRVLRICVLSTVIDLLFISGHQLIDVLSHSPTPFLSYYKHSEHIAVFIRCLSFASILSSITLNRSFTADERHTISSQLRFVARYSIGESKKYSPFVL